MCPHCARPRCVHAHVFSSQSLNEVFAENLQFPHGLNLAKIAFLTLLGFNSNKPPLYYGTRSHCLALRENLSSGRKNGEGKREIKEGRRRKTGRQTDRSCSPEPGDPLTPGEAAGRASGASRSAARSPDAQDYFWCGFTSHAPSHPALLKTPRGAGGKLDKTLTE